MYEKEWDQEKETWRSSCWRRGMKSRLFSHSLPSTVAEEECSVVKILYFCSDAKQRCCGGLGRVRKLTLAKDSPSLGTRGDGRKAEKTPPSRWTAQGLPKTGTRARDLRNLPAPAMRFAPNNKHQQAPAGVASGAQRPFLRHKRGGCSELGWAGEEESPPGLQASH